MTATEYAAPATVFGRTFTRRPTLGALRLTTHGYPADVFRRPRSRSPRGTTRSSATLRVNVPRIPPARVVERQVLVERIVERVIVRYQPSPPAMEETDVYRLYDTNDVLLYVGVGTSAQDRWREHAAQQPWWPEVARHETLRYPIRAQALAVEHAAIRFERPRHNRARGGLTDPTWPHGWTQPRRVDRLLPRAPVRTEPPVEEES